jgi:solute carrier family 25 (adenine nucleotide translocator) protein 4/5/6/31
MSEWALVNLLRHGERSQDKSNIHLTPEGGDRAQYIARCAAADTPSLAFPLGPPTKLVASFRSNSVRPFETLKPLGQKLNLPIENTIVFNDMAGFHRYVQENLQAGETLLAAWQHWFVPFLAKSLDPNGLVRSTFPTECKFTEWTEPGYTNGACYDLISQLQLYRSNASHPWRLQAYSQMHMGFGGNANSSCASAFLPYSNPTGWKLATAPKKGLWTSHVQNTIEILSAILIVLAVLLGLKQTLAFQSSNVARGSGLPTLLRNSCDGSYKEPLLASDIHHEAPRRQSSYQILVLTVFGILLMIASLMTSEVSNTMMSLSLYLTHALPMAFLFNFCAGGFSGALAKKISAPIERVKLLIQTQDRIPSIASGEVPRYAGIIDCAVRVYQEQGLKAFWRGNLPNVLRYFPVAAFNFAFKDAIEGCFPKYDPKTQFLQLLLVNLASGGIAGAGSLTIVYPLDYARTRLAGDIGKDSSKDLPQKIQESSQARQFAGLGDCLLKTVRSQGFFALYSGYAVSVIGIIAYRAPYFGLYDTFNAFNPWDTASSSWRVYICGLAASFVLAQITSAIAAFVSYPLDTVRRRLQMEADMPVESRKYKGAFHCLEALVEAEGLGGLYKGFLANLLRGAGTAFMLVLFQQITGMAGTA